MEKNYQKRIEKISQAIYLVSNHLKDNEPLKSELRKESIGFLSCIRTIEETGEGGELPADLVVDALSTYAKDLLSLITLGVVAGLISRANGEIITGEIRILMASFGIVEGVEKTRAGLILSQEFFAQLGKGHDEFLSDRAVVSFGKKTPFSKSGAKNSDAEASKSLKNKGFRDSFVKDKKDSRQMKILTLLKAQSNLSIKDFAAVIPDCSEKTIQRELLELVEKGVIKKEGEKRWSTYSIK